MLSSQANRLVTFIEQYWFEYGAIPTTNQMEIGTGLRTSEVNLVLAQQDVQKALTNRGLDVIPSAKLLSPEQLAVANTILDFSDDRTVKQKLKDLGVTHRQYSAWLKLHGFRTYLNARAEQLFGDAMPEAHLALVNQVRRGDLPAIKLFYEMTGRWSSKTVEETNIEFLMMKLIEIIQKHVHDPVALGNIAEEIGALMPGPHSGPPVGALPQRGNGNASTDTAPGFG